MYQMRNLGMEQHPRPRKGECDVDARHTLLELGGVFIRSGKGRGIGAIGPPACALIWAHIAAALTLSISLSDSVMMSTYLYAQA